MVPLSIEHYAAIGKIAVQCGILERELDEYLRNLSPGAKSPDGLRRKLWKLREALASATPGHAASLQLERMLDKVLELVLQRNTVVHGVWEADSTTPLVRSESIAIGDVSVRARGAASVANNLRSARMLLLHLLAYHCPAAASGRERPKSDPQRLRAQLNL